MVGYEVLQKLAEGSAAQLFLARDEVSDDRVLHEVIRPEFTRDAGIYGRFLDEAKGRQKLSHPNLVRRKSAGCAPDGRLFVVTEPLSGEHLGHQLHANGPLSVRAAVRILVPICEALEYLHAHGHVHGNLRPSYVYPGDPRIGRGPKLVDTGLSLFRAGGMSVVPPSPVVMVEPEYLCPERIRGERGNAASDVYGLGVLMFELLTGMTPFTGPSPEETRRRHLASPVPVLPDTALALTPVLLRCLAKSREDRFPSMTAVRIALTGYLTEAGATPVPANAFAAPQATHNDRQSVPPSGAVLPQGTALGVYEVQGLLGEGGMGRVYRARHTKLGRTVALKVLHLDQARDPIQRERFFQEARAVNQAAHENIVEIHDVVEAPADEGNHLYCVMEYLEGVSLKQLARQEPLSLERVVHIAMQICAALDAAHRVHVVHRDVKPDNVFLIARPERRDFVKVLDFGIAKLRVSLDSNVDFSVTRPGSVVGTPTYMSPEQASGKEVGPTTDIYSLGVVLYGLLAGRPPFEAPSLGQLVVSIVTEPPPPLPLHTPAGERTPDKLRQAVGRALAKEPRARFRDMTEFGTALALSLSAPEEVPFVAAHDVQELVAVPAGRSRVGARVGVALGLLATVGSAAFLFTRPTRILEVPPPSKTVAAARLPALPETVTVLVTSSPTGAQVSRADTNAPLGLTPLTLVLPRGQQLLSLELVTFGHRSEVRSMRLDKDARVQVTLVPLLPPKATPARRPARRGGK